MMEINLCPVVFDSLHFRVGGEKQKNRRIGEVISH